jgi:hypothetical protein
MPDLIRHPEHTEITGSDFVMPDLIRHPEHTEITGFRLPPE